MLAQPATLPEINLDAIPIPDIPDRNALTVLAHVVNLQDDTEFIPLCPAWRKIIAVQQQISQQHVQFPNRDPFGLVGDVSH